MCITGKKSYSTAGEAEAAMRLLNRDNPRRKEQRAYLCPLCVCWHLTSHEPKVRK